MEAQRLPPAFDEVFDFLVEKATPKEILAFQLSEAAHERAEELLERNKEGTLTPEENQELDQLIELDLWLAVLKAKARAALRQS